MRTLALLQRHRRPLIVTLGLALAWIGWVIAAGQQEDDTMARRLNVPTKTMGGAQWWTDHLHRGGYRIQQSSLTGHGRMLDHENVRRAWGSREDVDLELAERIGPETPAPAAVTVLIHGLGRTQRCMIPLEEILRADGHEEVIRFSYASARQKIGDSAAALRHVLDGYPPATRFRLVGHSMGNILTRRMVGDLQTEGDPAGLLDRIDAMVMLGPPNQGAEVSKRLGDSRVFGWVAGPGALELGRDWDGLLPHLPSPPFRFAIFAGNVPESSKNPLIDGPGDGVVTVEETRLDGSQDFKEFPVLHTFLMTDPAVMQATAEFLRPLR